jgi:hypothetical protein
MEFWNNSVEKQFFIDALKLISPEKLFYQINREYYAYIPNGVMLDGQTLQSRNTHIGKFTEKWCKDLFSPLAEKYGLFAVNGVVCNEIGLHRNSSADLAFCTSNSINQKAKDIKIIFEIKMSIVSNYKYLGGNNISFNSDYKGHKGNPSLLRSDSMLKAIGKAINIRVSSPESSKIPIIILGNSPITQSYFDKVDYLQKSGVVQYFLSLNPSPTATGFIFNSPCGGFQTIDSEIILENLISHLLESKLFYFSSMVDKNLLGRIISMAANENTDIARAEKFLSLINE